MVKNRVLEGRAMAHIVTGAGYTSYELPYLVNLGWENSLANPANRR